MLRELGITIFLSCVGLNAGIKFFDVLLNGDGFYYMALSAIITFFPLMIVAIVGKAVFKVNYLSLCGVLAGATTDPPALAFANGLRQFRSDEHRLRICLPAYDVAENLERTSARDTVNLLELWRDARQNA